MARMLLTRKAARLSPLIVGSMVAVALGAVTPALAANPTDSGRLTFTDEDGSYAVWTDGTPKALESFSGAGFAIIGNWNAAGTQVIGFDASDRHASYVFDDGGTR